MRLAGRTVETGKRLVLFTFGTRPEAIKLAPVIHAFRADPSFATQVCVTAQHRELLDQVIEHFDLRPDFDLDLMSPGQSLGALTSRVLAGCEEVFTWLQPDLVFVQGDTTSAFGAALAAGLSRIPVAHLEAGLRSARKDSPFPEQINRVMIAGLADLHFAPSESAARNLRREGITRGVHVVGNTVVDALKLALLTLENDGDAPYLAKYPQADGSHKILLVTLHRRESQGMPLAEMCAAVRRIALADASLQIFLPVHPSPPVQSVVQQVLRGLRNVHLLEPLGYLDFIWLLARAALVISDSGGVLEEAETLGLPVLVAREVTERVEAIAGGNAQLVGSDGAQIYRLARELLEAAPPRPLRPLRDRPLRLTFGDGNAAPRIVRLTREHLAAATASQSGAASRPLALAHDL